MLGELVTVVTEDRVRLDGFFARPPEQGDGFEQEKLLQNRAVDAAVIVHGLSGNFYKSRLLKHLAHQLVAHGIPTVLANTRGHDYLNSTARMGRAQTLGAAVEVVDEARFDMYAWAEFLGDQNYERILLMGHSLGAIKSLLAQARNPHPKVKALACLSATRLSENALLNSKKGERFGELLDKARALVEQDNGDQLIFVDFPFPTWMSAKAYSLKYGSGESNNWISVAGSIRVPTLCLFGRIELDENPAFIGMENELSQVVDNNPSISVEVIEGADHFYSARALAASEKIIQWLASID